MGNNIFLELKKTFPGLEMRRNRFFNIWKIYSTFRKFVKKILCPYYFFLNLGFEPSINL
jgi:hypothetical protein